jgi:tRNA dimethylallyltransferase
MLRQVPSPDPVPTPKQVIALFGPTGVGKTDVALAVAQRLRDRGERPVAVSADALQVYRGLEILTGTATRSEQEGLEHRLISFLPVGATFSVAQYARMAHAEIDTLIEEGATPIVVGGTGLYLRAALAELDLKPAPPPELRERWEREIAARGAEQLHLELRERAPGAADRIDPRDRSRIIRAHELLDLGEALDDAPREQLWTSETRHPTRLIGLIRDREELYERIDRRVDAMVSAGAEREVREANAAGASETARKALGFEELLAGDVDAMKRRTRNYARRQLTWMRKLPGVELVDLTGRHPADVAARLLDP